MRKEVIGLLGILLFFLILRSFYFDFIPLWDGYEYYQCLIPALRQSFSLGNFDCFGHPSGFYMVLVGLLQYLDPGNILLYHISLSIVHIISIVAFYALLRVFFPEKKYSFELLLLTLLFAVYPFIFSHTLQLNLDSGMLLFLLLFLNVLLRESFFLAALMGIGLVFTKETALFIYIPAIFLYWLLCIKTKKDKPIPGSTYTLLALTPIFLYILNLFIKINIFNSEFLWINFKLAKLFVFDNEYKQTLTAYLVNIFLLQFNWILSITILSALIYILYKRVNIREHLQIIKSRQIIFIILLFLTSLPFFLLVHTFSHLRYFLPFYPLLLFFFYLALHVYPISRQVRIGILIVVTTIFLFSNYYTFDPVSQYIYGVFPFGTHRMLYINFLNKQCCGYGLDGLVYNTEFTYLHYLVNQIYQDIHPTEKTYIVVGSQVQWGFPSALDKNTFSRTVKKEGSIMPKYLQTTDIQKMKNKPQEMYYIALPNADNRGSYTLLEKWYRTKKQKVYTRNGYAIQVGEMVLRK